jgi:hypothetical protein
MIMNRSSTALLLSVALSLAAATSQPIPARAQTAPQPTAPTQGQPVGGTQPKASKAATGAKNAPKPAADSADPARSDGSAQLRQRIDQLEEQINEMHVAVGTLDSLAKNGAGRASNTPQSGGGVSGDAS